MLKAQLITIGDEFFIEQYIAINSLFITKKFNEIGLEIARMISVRDNFRDLRWAFSNTQNSKIILSTGGLNSNQYGLIKNFLCNFFDDKLVFNEQVYQSIQFLDNSKRERSLNVLTKNQAYIPSKAILLPNIHGTTPGLWMEKNRKIFIYLPGIPLEMKYLLMQEVIPRLKKRFKHSFTLYQTLTISRRLTESIIVKKIQDWKLELPKNIHLSCFPSDEIVRLRLSGKKGKLKILEKQLKKAIDKLSHLIGPRILSYQDEPMEKIIGIILKKKKLTIATAESCTGGSIASKIVSISGSSDYYKGSIIAYNFQIKTECLDVDPALIQKYGAVSKEVVEAMAIGVKKKLKTSLALATSGLVGPGKGEESSDIGTLCIGLAIDNRILSEELYLEPDERTSWIEKASIRALEYLFRYIS